MKSKQDPHVDMSLVLSLLESQLKTELRAQSRSGDSEIYLLLCPKYM